MLGRGFIDGSGTSPAPRPGRSTLRVAGRLRWRPWRTSAFGIPPVLLAFAAALILLLSAGAEAVDAQADTVAPELATMDPAVLAADGLTLTLTYNEALNTSSVPASTAFEVKATPPGTGASEGTVAVATTGGVAVTGSTVVLTLSRPIAHSDTSVKVSYTVPTNSPIEDAGNNPAGALTDQAVDNNSTVPYVSIVALHDDATPGIAEPVFRVTRSLVSTDELEVKFTITQGTEYFRSTTHTIDIPANQTSGDSSVFRFALCIFVDCDPDNARVPNGNLTATVTVDDAYRPAPADNAATVQVKMPASDTDPAVTVEFDRPDYSVTEGGPVSVTTTATTAAGVAKPRKTITVSLLTSDTNATATIHVDYRHVTRNVPANVGDWTEIVAGNPDGGYTAMQTTTVDTIEDEDIELPETFFVFLDTTPGVSSLVVPTDDRAVVTITGDDQGLVLAASGVEVTSTATNGTYAAAETIDFTFTFNGDVTVTGAPHFTFELGGGTRSAPYTSGSGSTKLVFSYTVLSTDPDDTDGISYGANALALNGGTIMSVVPGRVAPGLAHIAQTALTDHKVDAGKPAWRRPA